MTNKITCFVIVTFISLSLYAQQDTVAIKKTHWLVGTWQGIHNGQPFYETWRKKEDNTLVCYSVSFAKGDTSIKVNSSINFREGGIIFEDPQVWKSSRVMPNEMTFELNTKRGLNRIIWMLTKEGHWWAILQFPSNTTYYDLVRNDALDKAINKFLPK